MNGRVLSEGVEVLMHEDKRLSLLYAGRNEGVNGKKWVSILRAIEPARKLPSVCAKYKSKV